MANLLSTQPTANALFVDNTLNALFNDKMLNTLLQDNRLTKPLIVKTLKAHAPMLNAENAVVPKVYQDSYDLSSNFCGSIQIGSMQVFSTHSGGVERMLVFMLLSMLSNDAIIIFYLCFSLNGF
jgi:hypothetical protein